MVFRDNIVYKNDNTISKNHLIFISNKNVYVTIRLLIKPVSKEKGRASK